jgi:hypothetical protein
VQDPVVIVEALIADVVVVVEALDVELADPDEPCVSRRSVTEVGALTCDFRADSASGELGGRVEDPWKTAGHGHR